MGNTVFVVGAGASCEFGGLPVGSQLAEAIEHHLALEIGNREGPITSSISRNGGYSDVHRSAMSRILSGISSRDSIDQFVDDCRTEPTVAQVAKLSIAYCVLEGELNSKLYIQGIISGSELRGARDTWLGLVCRYANPGVNRQDFLGSLSGVTFVTFNYDRCIDQFLLTWARNVLAQPPEAAAVLVSKIPRIHAFGKLGKVVQDDRNLPQIEFGDKGASSLWPAHLGIKTFTEEIRSDHGTLLREKLREADTIVFLGFHFHPQNMQILFDTGWPQEKRVFATVMGIGDRGVKRIKRGLDEGGNAHRLVAGRCGDLIAQFGEEIFEDD